VFTAEQTSEVKQGGDASSGRTQSGIMNFASWDGLVVPPSDGAPAARMLAAPQALVAAEPLIQSPPAGFGPVSPPQAPPKLRPRRLHAVRLPAVHYSLAMHLSAPAPASAPWAIVAARIAKTTAAQKKAAQHYRWVIVQPTPRTPVCMTCGDLSLFGAIGGAHA